MSEGCTILNDPYIDGDYVSRDFTTYLSFYAGDTIIVKATTPAGGVPNDIHFYIAGGLADIHDTTFPATLIYTFAADTAISVFGWSAHLNSGGSHGVWVTWNVSCVGGSKGSAPAASHDPVAGPEMGLVTPGSVMGLIVTDADAYYAPDQLTKPLITLPAGKTVWVVGMDASKTYYKVIWSSTYLWIKVGTIGPDPEPLWQNWPLPDRIVE